MQPLLDRVGFDLEHQRDLLDGKPLPRAEPEHLDIRSTEACRSAEDELMLVGGDHRLVRGGRGTAYDREKAIIKPASPCRTAPLMTNDTGSHAVQPQECGIPSRDVLEAAPRGQERLGDRIIDQIRRQPSPAEITNGSVVAVVQRSEEGALVGTDELRVFGDLPHITFMPGYGLRLREKLA